MLYLFFYLSIFLSFYLSIFLSFYLSLRHYIYTSCNTNERTGLVHRTTCSLPPPLPSPFQPSPSTHEEKDQYCKSFSGRVGREKEEKSASQGPYSELGLTRQPLLALRFYPNPDWTLSQAQNTGTDHHWIKEAEEETKEGADEEEEERGRRRKRSRKKTADSIILQLTTLYKQCRGTKSMLLHKKMHHLPAFQPHFAFLLCRFLFSSYQHFPTRRQGHRLRERFLLSIGFITIFRSVLRLRKAGMKHLSAIAALSRFLFITTWSKLLSCEEATKDDKTCYPVVPCSLAWYNDTHNS